MTQRYVGRELTDTDIEMVCSICADPAYPTRAAIARELCRGCRSGPSGTYLDGRRPRTACWHGRSW